MRMVITDRRNNLQAKNANVTMEKRGELGRRQSRLLAQSPDFFTGPALRPIGRDVRVMGGGVGRCLQFGERFDEESAAAKEGDPLAIGQGEFDGVIVGPFDAM